MEHEYINNLFFTYFPHIAMAVFWFGLITRLVKIPGTIQANSSQFLSKSTMGWASNLFHVGIIAVFFGHFIGLFTPESVYHLIMTTANKRLIAIIAGGFFGWITLAGIFILIKRRLTNKRIRTNSNFQDYFIIFLLLSEVVLGLIAISTTATATVENYAELGIWAQKVITFQPDAGAVIAGHSIIYKLHIVVGLLIFIIFPYTKLMHMLVIPLGYFFRSGYQNVRSRLKRI